jgi:HAD superfamily hydrolase (TIGR01509 family)
MLHALLFDMNGVIVDDIPFHERAWVALAARHGRTLTPDEFRRDMSGRRNRDNIRHLFGESLSDAEVHAYQLEKEQAYRDAYRPHRAPLPGLVPLLVEARAAGLKIAVVTSAPEENIDFVLDGLDLRRRFDAVVGEAEVKHSKPDPEIYRLAASRLGEDRTACVVFEDSLAGIASGIAAGMPVVGVTTTHTADELRQCALVIADFRGLTVADLARLTASP